jgi:uncharacterized membrane protein YecN with MAPEG domain
MLVYLACSGVLVILYFALGLNVSRLRGQTQTGIGTGADPSGPLNKAVRAHGNAAEYVPIFLALFLYFSLSTPAGWIVWVAVIVTVCRVLHAAGMLVTRTFDAPPHPLRAIGAGGTYLGGLVLGVALLLRAFVR